jgi:hypothetical protein
MEIHIRSNRTLESSLKLAGNTVMIKQQADFDQGETSTVQGVWHLSLSRLILLSVLGVEIDINANSFVTTKKKEVGGSGCGSDSGIGPLTRGPVSMHHLRTSPTRLQQTKLVGK